MNSILICGYGNIGKYLETELCHYNPDIYDPLYNTMNKYEIYDIAFIAVPTNNLPDNTCDISIVEKVITEVKANLYVIKSTIIPGSTTELINKTKKHIVFSPEFYGTTLSSNREVNFLILGGNQKDKDIVANLYTAIKRPSFRIFSTTLETAELVKYMLNSFLALKVTFCNEFAKLAGSIGVSYTELRTLFVQDERVGDSHTWVFPEKPYYDSHCFNKDIPALIKFAEDKAPLELLKRMDEINKKLKLI